MGEIKSMSKISSELKTKAREIYDCDDNVLRYLIESKGSVEFTPKKNMFQRSKQS